MLRGSQKRMIVVRTRDSRLFEEAYFVMRRGTEGDGEEQPDMLWEANRILENTATAEENPPKTAARGFRRLLWFAAGALSGGSAVGLLWLLL